MDKKEKTPAQEGGVTRREFLVAGTALGTAAILGSQLMPGLSAQAQAPAKFELPPLPYPTDALEPHIDKLTMEIHHGRHHLAYITNLNSALERFPDLQKRGVEDLLRDLGTLPEEVRTQVRNHGGGHHNHALFWTSMAPGPSGEPDGALAAAIKKDFGDFTKLKEQIAKAATSRFGSGWGWLVAEGAGNLKVISTANQDSPLMEKQVPLLGIDVWEHAYYLKYQNKRADYITAWWNVVNWKEVAARYAKLKQ